MQVITAKGQSFDAAYLLPGSTSVVDMTAHSVGDWMYQCDVQARVTACAMSQLLSAGCLPRGHHVSANASIVAPEGSPSCHQLALPAVLCNHADC